MIAVALLWVGLIGGAKWVQRDLNVDRPSTFALVQAPAVSDELKVYWDVPPFSFPDQDGRTVTDQDLRGHVWICDFFFSQCTTACPILTSKLMLVQKRVQSPAVRFISFSVDPEHDSPPVLKQYAKLWEGDESRWKLLSTNPTDLSKVALGMKVIVAPSGDKDNPILHSSMFMLVDVKGQVRGIYDSIDTAAITRLVDDAKSLDQSAMATTAPMLTAGSNAVDRGHSLFGSMGCLACHSQVRIAPPLQSLYGSQVRLDNRRTVWADEAYLHESIVDPNAKIVAGYLKTMPSYHQYLNDQQVMDLVAYIESLSSNKVSGHGVVTTATTAEAEQELAVDPVCKMQVTKDSSGPHATFNGKTYFFCSNHCLEQFQRKPEKYVLTEELLH